MSTKDISRFLFQPRKHYVGMRMQQGRVLLDSDHNEGAWHDDEDQRRTLLDLIGPQGSPDLGFFLGILDGTEFVPLEPGQSVTLTSIFFNGAALPSPVPNYYVLPGSMFVGGLRYELEQAEHIAFQNDFLEVRASDLPAEVPSGEFGHFFYLHTWEQCVTAVEDEEVLERALGGPDTSVRVRRMRRVEFANALEGEDCAAAFTRVMSNIAGEEGHLDPASGEIVSSAGLFFTFQPGEAEDTCAPCDPDPSGRYLGAENQAIRIMQPRNGFYVWAFDNGSPLYRVSITGVGDPPAGDVVVKMLTLPKDEEHRPTERRVVEILPWSAVLENGERVAGEVGVLCRVLVSFNSEEQTFTLDPTIGMAALNELVHAWDAAHPRADDLDDAEAGERLFYARFWHESQTDADVEIPTENSDTAPPLGTTGLVPHFPFAGRRGDFWVAAVRPETPNRIVPFDLLGGNGALPHGPRHFYAPIAIVRGTGGATLGITSVVDCRRPIRPESEGCCTLTVGDGVNSAGQFRSIQAAIDALPDEGGRVCIGAGTFTERLVIDDLVDITIEGCGDATVIMTPPDGAGGDLINVNHATRITIRDLQLHTINGSAIAASDSSAFLTYTDLRVVELPVDTATPTTSGLITFNEGDSSVMRRLRIHPIRQTAIVIDSSRGSRIDEIKVERLNFFSPPPATMAPPDGPLIQIGAGGTVVFTNSELRAESQIGIQLLDVTDCRFESLEINAGQYLPDVPARSAIDAILQAPLNMEDITIHDCRITMFGHSEYAAVDLSGSNIVFTRNMVSAGVVSGPGPWGGVYIRQGSNIRILNNRISGGRGHGITLGDIEWLPFETQGFVESLRLPPGKLQLVAETGVFTGDLRGGFEQAVPGEGNILFVADVDGTLEDLVIGENVIDSTGGNGISAITVLGAEGTFAISALVSCRRLVIERNHIENCLGGPLFVTPSADFFADVVPIGGSRQGSLPAHGVRLPPLPYGGIVLPVVNEYAQIRDNIIRNNGKSFDFLPPGEEVNELIQPAYSGIFVLLGESIDISGNRLMDNGVLFDPAMTLLSGARAGITVVYAANGIPSSTPNNLNGAFPDPLPPNPANPAYGSRVWDFALRIVNNTVTQPEGRALFALTTGAVTVAGNYFASRGMNDVPDVDVTPDTLAIGDVVYLHNLGLPWEVLGDSPVQSFPPLPDTPDLGTSYLVNRTWRDAPVLFAGFGGHVLFNDNQVVLDWRVLAASNSRPLSYFPVAVVSLDHVSMRGNQFAFRMEELVSGSPPSAINPANADEELLVATVFVLGATVDVSGNRAAEKLEQWEGPHASLMTVGLLMNTTAFNQTTRCVLAFQGDTGEEEAAFLQTTGNLVMRPPNNITCVQLKDTSSVQNFVESIRNALVQDRRP